MVALFFGHPLEFRGTLQRVTACYKLIANLKLQSLNPTDLRQYSFYVRKRSLSIPQRKEEYLG